MCIGGFFKEEKIYISRTAFLQIFTFSINIIKNEEESWILSSSMPGTTEILKINRNTKIAEDLGATTLPKS